MNRKFKIISISFLSIATVVILVYLRISSVKKQKIEEVKPSLPTLIKKYEGAYSITLSVDKNQFKFPDKLPFLVFESSNTPLTKEYALKVSSNLNFSQEPIVIEDTQEGTTYFWKNDNGTLFIYLKSKKIRFSNSSLNPGINKQLSEEEITSMANEFILDNQLLEQGSFKTSNVKFLRKIPKGEGYEETTKDKGEFFQVNILPNITSYEIISTSSVQPSSYIQIYKDGSIKMFQITIFPPLINGSIEYKLKSYDDIKSSLDKAVLIELRGYTALLSDLPSNYIKTIDVNKIEISYLLESFTSKFLQPVYKLSGTATTADANNYGATLYLPAISQN